jgi:hypothetical protein
MEVLEALLLLGPRGRLAPWAPSWASTRTSTDGHGTKVGPVEPRARLGADHAQSFGVILALKQRIAGDYVGRVLASWPWATRAVGQVLVGPE